MEPEYRCDDISMLHPLVVRQYQRLEDRLKAAFEANETRTLFSVFETYRSPERQALLLFRKKTKARAWESAHQYGLAADFVPYATRLINGGVNSHSWSWDLLHDWPFLAEEATRFGLATPIEWDRPHVQSSRWTEVRKLLQHP